MIKKYYKMGPMFGPAVVSQGTGGPIGTMDIGTRRRHQLAGRRSSIRKPMSVFCARQCRRLA